MSPDEEVDLGHTIAKSEELNLPVRIFPSYYKVFSPILGGGVCLPVFEWYRSSAYNET